ncbi:unnamed protein product [Cylindrotheca closterium]|nr:unnamed protein product [Cylindrotheca closterium]
MTGRREFSLGTSKIGMGNTTTDKTWSTGGGSDQGLLHKSLEISQIVFWDETHTKCVIGAGAGRDFVFVFPRDSNGNLNPDGGTYTDTKFKRLKVKYEKEVRLCLGCAAVQINGQDEYVGKRCVPFDYSGKTILSISDYKSKCQAEIQRVRALKGEVPPWYLKTRVKDKCYRNDTVRIGLKRVGKVLQEQFQMINIFTIQDLIKTEGSFADRRNPCPPGCKLRVMAKR